MGEENRARAARARNRWFFAMMKSDMRDRKVSACLTVPAFALQSSGSTVSWTQSARGQERLQLLELVP
jgi:hypothetical protein